MTTKSSVYAGSLFNLLLVITFISLSIAANIPESEWPFEFNHDRGSTVTENNVLTQSVSSDGQTVLNTNEPQPIKKYHSATATTNNNKNNNNYKKTKIQSANSNGENTKINYQNLHKIKPGNYGNHGLSYTTTYTSPMMMNDQWGLLENFNKYIEP